MNLLVTGAKRVDAGKTTFSAGLVAHTGAVGFKPRAGNDYWFHHDDVRYAADRGRLFGKDAKTLAATSPATLDPEEINPVHRLWRPSPGPDQGVLGQDDREFLVDRAGEQFVVNGTVDVPEAVRTALPIDDALVVGSTEELNRAMKEYHLPALNALAGTVASTDRVVVESYGDIARPLQTVDPDGVAVVEPLRTRIYDGSRFVRACEVATRSPYEGQLEKRVGAVEDLIDPAATADLQPIDGDTRDDPSAVADAYAGAYGTLLDVVGE